MIAWVAAPAALATEAKADGSVGFWDSIPVGSVTLILVALAAAVALSLALGPMGRPRPVARRSGGLTRALARTQPGADTSDEPAGEEPMNTASTRSS